MRAPIKVFVSMAVVAICCALGANMPASGQRKPGQQPSPSPVPAGDDTQITVSIRRVRLPVTVLDKKNQLVSGLTKSDFIVLEDKQPQEIETFSDERGEPLPISVGVLLDTSPSTAGKLKFEQESALNFIQTVARPRRDRVAFVTFDDEIKLRQDFTDKYDLLQKAVEGIKKPGSQTALYDAIWQFCDEKMRSAPGRRALVVVTDGEDTYSRANLRDAIDIAQRTETTVFAVSTKGGFLGTVPGVDAGQVNNRAERDLVRLCEETGGAAFFTGDMLALEKSFTKISNELHTQYLITYKPRNDKYDGSFRSIEVKLAGGHSGMKVRTKRGYTAVADNVRH